MSEETKLLSSEWRQVPEYKAIELDDELARSVTDSWGLRERVNAISGWHFEQISKHSDLFPTLSKTCDLLNIESIEDLREKAKFTLGRYLHRNSLNDSFNTDIASLIARPIFIDFFGFRENMVEQTLEVKIGPVDVEMERIQSTPLMELFNETLNKYPEKTQSVVRYRLGADGRRHTLEEVGQKMGVTRERIRQIEKNFFQRSEKAERWDDLMREKLSYLFQTAAEPLGLVALEIKDEWFRGISTQPLVFDAILKKYNNSVDAEFHFYVNFDFGPEPILTITDSDDLHQSVMDAKKLVKEFFRQSSRSRSELEVLVGPLCPRDFQIYTSLFVDKVIDSAVTSASDDETLMLGKGSRRSLLHSMLTNDKTMEWSVSSVKKYGKEKFDVLFKDNEITSAFHELFANEVLVQLDRSKWGSVDLLDLDDQKNQIINDYLLSVIKSGDPLRQWHCQEIADSAPKYISNLLKFDEFSLYYSAYHSGGKIACLGRLIIGDPRFFQGSSDRYEIEHLVYDILKTSGRPMKTKEIKSEILKKRGLGRNFQIHPGERMVIVSPGVFGLSEWYGQVSDI
jgi:hypothetical protein